VPEAWESLLPLIIASALVPFQLMITVLLLRSSFKCAAAWVSGITFARLAQGLVLVLAVVSGVAETSSDGPPRWLSILFLMLAAVFYVAAVQQLFRPSAIQSTTPGWLKRVDTVSATTAFWSGAAYLTLSVKSTVLNLAGLGVILKAGSRGPALLWEVLAFIALAEVGHLAILAMARLSPDRSEARLVHLNGWLQRHARVIVIVIGFVFGSWFLKTALEGLGRI